jgi:hypothetical protein
MGTNVLGDPLSMQQRACIPLRHPKGNVQRIMRRPFGQITGHKIKNRKVNNRDFRYVRHLLQSFKRISGKKQIFLETSVVEPEPEP